MNKNNNFHFYANKAIATTLSICMLGACGISIKKGSKKTNFISSNTKSYTNITIPNKSTMVSTSDLDNINNNIEVNNMNKVSDTDIKSQFIITRPTTEPRNIILPTRTTVFTTKNNTLTTTTALDYVRKNGQLLNAENDTEVYLTNNGKVYVIYNNKIVNTFKNIDIYEGSLKADSEEYITSSTTELTTTTVSRLQDIINNSIIETMFNDENNTIAYQDLRNDKIYVVKNNKIVAEYPDVDTYESISKGDILYGYYHIDEVTTPTSTTTKPTTDPSLIQDIIDNSIISNISNELNTDKITYYKDQRDGTLYLITNDNSRVVAEYSEPFLYYNPTTTTADSEKQTTTTTRATIDATRLDEIKSNSIIYDVGNNENGEILAVEDGNDGRVYVVVNDEVIDEYENRDAYNNSNIKYNDERYKTYSKTK